MKPDQIDAIIIHCSATRVGQNIHASDIDKWHREQGFAMIGYNYVIDLDGTVETGRPLTMDGAHCMLFRAFSGQLMMACHGPNDHPRKRILLFEMEETPDALHILNEVTGNWYGSLGGHGAQYAYPEPCREPPCFTRDPRKPDGKDGKA